MPRLRISDYPEAKIIVECEKYGLSCRYDRAAMIAAGGNRPLPALLDAIAERHGCEKTKGNARLYDRCCLRYKNIA